jgi:DNA-binding transcriptional LysR family regulator
MELFQVRYFLAVCRTKNFTRAAEECNVSQPALSRAVQQLEAELGGELFRRERSLTHMTDLGRAVCPALNESYEAAMNAKSVAQCFLKQGHAPLHIALSRSMELDLISPLLGEITTAFPQIEIKIFRGPPQEIYERLKNGDDEIAIAGTLDDSWDRLNVKKLFEERFGLLMHRNHNLSRQNSIEITDLTRERLLCRPYCTLTDELERRMRELGAKSVAKHEVPLIDDLADLVRAKFGVGVWPASRRLGDDLALRDVNGVEMSRWIHVYSVAGRKHSPASSALINLLRARDWSELSQLERQAAGALH